METMQAIDTRIRKTFTVLEKIAQGVANGHIRSAIVSGATGCGKSYTLESVLKNAERDGRINYNCVRGTISAITLYQELWNARKATDVLVLDDTDSIYGDLDALNLLKAALDTNPVRRVHYNKESRILAELGIDKSFDFLGRVVFITNTDLTRAVEKTSKMSPHYAALLSRSIYCDLGIHTKREVLVRIAQVIYSERFLTDNNITRAEAEAMMSWLAPNINRVRVLSIRTVLQLADLVKVDSDWQSLADTLVLKAAVAELN
jgi:ABC-type dipeptide/oligopeptide/nickel transport system ATPase component